MCPGVMEGVPASRDFEGGFATQLMLKDLTLALQAANAAASPVPTGEHAHSIFGQVAANGWEAKDFGAVYRWLEEGGKS
jgi:3-hydroxyisobutyrate dehydrogenase-like beta-hydroxyacid dehydrogenase